MFKKSMVYLAIVYLIQILNIVLNILLIRLLPLEQLGQITIAKVFFQFMDYTHLGSRFAMDRYVPTHTEEDGKKLTIFTMNISLFVSAFFIVLVYFFINNSFIVLIFMISGFLFAIGTIYKAYFRAREETNQMFFVILLSIFLPLIVQIITISFFDFNTFIFLFFISYITGFFLLVYKFRLIHLMTFSAFLDKAKSIYKAVSLLFLTSLILFLSFSIDKILLEHYKGSIVLGEYSIILFVFATLLIIPGTLAELVFPKIIKKVTATSKVIHLKEMAFIFFPTLLSIIMANLLMDYMIIRFTKYEYLLHYLHLVSWAVLPYAITSIMYHTLNALDQRKTLLYINFLVLLAYIGYLYFALLSLSGDILQEFIWGKIVYGILLVSFYVLYLKIYTTKVKKL
jgi:O-antigen/teichoic acid export membrane protein